MKKFKKRWITNGWGVGDNLPEIIRAMCDRAGMNMPVEKAALVLYRARLLNLSADEIAHVLSAGLGLDSERITKILFGTLGLSRENVVRALRNGLRLDAEQIWSSMTAPYRRIPCAIPSDLRLDQIKEIAQ